MHSFTSKLIYASLIISVAFVLMVATAIPASATQSTSTTDNAIVIGTKIRWLRHESSDVFKHTTSLIFEAPQIAGWTFDRIEVSFKLGSIGGPTSMVTSSDDVPKMFTVDGGYITNIESYCTE